MSVFADNRAASSHVGADGVTQGCVPGWGTVIEFVRPMLFAHTWLSSVDFCRNLALDRDSSGVLLKMLRVILYLLIHFERL